MSGSQVLDLSTLILTAYLALLSPGPHSPLPRKDAPDGRPIEPPGLGAIVPMPQVGGLHHRYVRRAA
jgi:hypothetical protein